MDAILNDARDLPLDRGGVSPQLRLPGEADEAVETKPSGPKVDARDRPSTATQPRSHKSTVLSTVGITFLIAAAGYMGYAQRAELERIPVVHQMTDKVAVMVGHKPFQIADNSAARTAHSHPMIPAKAPDDAGIHAPDKEGAVKAFPVAAQPAASRPLLMAKTPTVVPPHTETAAQSQLAQFDALQGGPVNAAAPAKPGPPAASPAVGKSSAIYAPSPATHGSAVPPSNAAMVKVATVASAPTEAAHPAAKLSVPAPATVTISPVDEALKLTPVPMTDQQQVAVLDLVTKLAILVRDEKTEIASLHDQVAGLQGTMNNQLAGFDRRLSIAEAKRAIDAAMGAAGGAVEQASLAGEDVRSSHHKAAPAPTPAPVAAPPQVRSVADYDIQAASPGLAMLSTADDGGSTIQVGIGDKVPGVGTVTSIYQRGTSWVVKTDHGMIQ